MEFIPKAAAQLANFLAGELELDKKSEAAVRYGAEIIIGAIVKLTIIILVAQWLGVLASTLMVIITSGGFRLLSGGVHCSSYGRCLALALVVFIPLAFLADWLSVHLGLGMVVLMAVIAGLSGLGAAYRWAPADTPNKRITSPRRIKKLKRLSILFVISWMTAMGLLTVLSFNAIVPAKLILASSLALLWQSFMLAPAGYTAVECIDRLMVVITNLSKGGV